MGERENRLELSESYLIMAKDKLDTASLLLREGKCRDSISRAYYSAFLSAKAALLLIGEEPKSHGGLITIFSLKFIKTNTIDRVYSKILGHLLNARLQSDYNPLSWEDEEDAHTLFEEATKFVDRMEKLSVELISKQ